MRKYIVHLIMLFPFISMGQGHYSDSLYNIGVTLYERGEYSDAIGYFTFCDSLDTQELDSNSNRNHYSKMWLASCYYKIGNEELASKLYPKYFSLPPVDRRKTVLSDSLYVLAVSYFETEDFNKALALLKKSASIEKKVLGKNSLYYYNSIKECGYLCYNMDRYKEAINYGKTAYEISKRIFGEYSAEAAESINNLIDYYGESGDFFNVQYLTTILESTYKELYDKDPVALSNALYEVFEYYNIIEDYPNAIRVLQKSIDIDESNSGEYCIKLYSLFELIMASHDYSSAMRVGEQCLSAWKSLSEQTNDVRQIIATILSKLSECYNQNGFIVQSIELKKQSLSTLESIEYCRDSLYVITLNNLAAEYSEIGDYQQALVFQKKFIDNLKVMSDTTSSNYSIGLSNLAYYHSLVGDYVTAYELGEKAIRIFEKNPNKELLDYYYLYNNIATHHANVGNYDKAIDILNGMLTTIENCYGKVSIEYATILNNITTYSSHISSDIPYLIKCQEECTQIIKKIYGEKNAYYISSVINLAVLYNETNPTRASNLLTGLESTCVSVFGKGSPKLILFYYNVANAYNSAKNYKQSLQYLYKAHDILITHDNLCYPIVFRIQSALFHIYKEMQQIDQMNYWKNHANSSISNLIQSELALLTPNEREKYWENYSPWFYEELPQTILYDTSSSNATLLFNSDLLSKGLLINSSTAIEEMLLAEDSSLLKKYYNNKVNRKKLNELLYSNNPSDILLLDSIYRELEHQERTLLKESKTLTNLADYYAINFDSIVAVLNLNEIAIEFLSVPFDSTTEYYAFCVKKDYYSPHVIHLFSSRDSLNSGSSILSTNIIYHHIWEKLEGELLGVNTVYFTPSGILNTIPIENSTVIEKSSATRYFSDKFTTYRLSSLRELYYAKSTHRTLPSGFNSVVLYGGLNYDESDEPINNTIEQSYILSDGLRNEKDIKVKFLPYTESEITNIIDNIPKSTQLFVYNGSLGTETSFKSLSGKKNDLIHIATHGFFSTENLYNKDKKLFNVTTLEDRTLTRSGLYMSGCNILKNTEYPTNDGVLTAREISELDLHGTKLVVLSSCQSGIGDLLGDGVYGLQRAFKKAGAGAIMMSLWKVDDYTTHLLMEEFYKNLMSGVSKHESLSKAQKTIREYTDENGVKLFSAPYYWASFILIDAF